MPFSPERKTPLSNVRTDIGGGKVPCGQAPERLVKQPSRSGLTFADVSAPSNTPPPTDNEGHKWHKSYRTQTERAGSDEEENWTGGRLITTREGRARPPPTHTHSDYPINQSRLTNHRTPSSRMSATNANGRGRGRATRRPTRGRPTRGSKRARDDDPTPDTEIQRRFKQMKTEER